MVFNHKLMELECNYKNSHDLAYAERTKIMMLDHYLFLTLDLLSPEKTHKIFELRPVLLADLVQRKPGTGHCAS